MKKLLLVSAVALTGSVMATTFESADSIGIYPVNGTSKETIVAVPFVGSSGDIQINQLVKADGLTAGDMIYALPTASGNSYSAWKLNNSKTAWEAITTAEVGSGVSLTAPSSENAALARGQAFWLVRAADNPGNFTFYVMGVGPSSAAGTTAITGGKWNLVGQSSATGTKTLNDIVDAVGNKGSVRLNDGTRYTYSNSKWYSVSGNVPTEVSSSTTLPVGEGFWIVSKASGTVNVAL